MIRRATAAVLVVAVQLAALSAPLAHVHADDHDSDHHAVHHDGGERHVHFDGHAATPTAPASGPQVDHGEGEETSAAHLFVAAATDPVDASAPPSPSFTLVVPPEIALGRGAQVTHGHDPPATATLGPRPPPTF